VKKIFAFFNIPILFFLVWVLFLSFTTTLSYGQQQVDDTSPDLNLDFDRNCATMEQDSILRMKYPELGSLDEFEIALQGRIKELEKNAALARTTDVIISIPVIVHIVHNGEAVGQGTNISAAQVQAQLEVLNEDFRRKPGTNGFNSSPVGADIEIEFCLAALDRNGNPMTEPGINRYNGRRATWSRDDIEGILKPATSWDPNKYYNIWTLSLGGEDERILGYAQFPNQSGLPGIPLNGGPASTDGVVVSYRQFGSVEKGSFPVMQAPYNRGRTLTHETGHWLGLRHIWGDGACGSDDFVSDTPESDQPNRGCPQGRVSCGSVDMVQNYMDYTDDACMNIFTQGQKTRMRAVMSMSPRRGSLITSNVCLPTVADGPPIPNFEADRRIVLREGTVNFTDLSINFPTGWLWTFEGGNPATSRDRNPTVIYDVPGTYDVTLTVFGRVEDRDTSMTLVMEDYILVSEAGVCGTLSNFEGTPTVLQVDSVQGYVAGHNSLKHRAKAEFFQNELGYTNLSAAFMNFGYAYSSRLDASVTVTVWNARGAQGSPGAVLERKEVLLREIYENIQQGRATEVIFERNVPLFGRGFYVGIELSYEHEDTVALVTNNDGESTQGTSWELDEEGIWRPYLLTWPVYVAHDITPVVGMKQSVQLFSSAQIINVGESVNMNARGASIFSWEPNDGSLNTSLGPQVVARPTQTTTYTVTGSGLDLCETTAFITIFVNAPTAVEENNLEKQLIIYPNPSSGLYKINFANELMGSVDIKVYNIVGELILQQKGVKNQFNFEHSFNLENTAKGVYIAQIAIGNIEVRKRIIRN
jgi:PKD repeat protein